MTRRLIRAVLAAVLLTAPEVVAFGSVADTLRESSAWEWRYPLPTGMALNDITYGANLFVAVGSRGTVLTSADGKDWNEQLVGGEDFHGVAYGDGRFVAVGYGVTAVSPDGVNWTTREIWAHPLHEAKFANGLWVAVGNGGTIFSSPDGLEWTERADGQTSDYRTVAHGGGRWVAMGSDLSISDDGKNWTFIEQPLDFSIQSVIYRDGKFHAIGSNDIYSSADGESWTTHDIDRSDSLNDLIFARNRFFAAGSSARILSSEDFSDWVEVESGDVDSSTDLNALAHGNGITLAVGDKGIVRHSEDGIDWSPHPERWDFNAAAYGNGRFLVAGDTLALSDDGNEWTYRSITPTIRAAVWTGDRFLLASEDQILTSSDGESLVVRHDAADNLHDIAYGEALAIAVGSDGSILRSSDLEQWAPVSSGTDEHLFAVAFGAGRFIAIGANGALVYSDDGENWSEGDFGVDFDLYDVAYGDGRFTAVGDARMFWSPNGEGWLPDNSVPSPTIIGTLSTATHANRTTIVFGTSGQILLRSDGGHWKGGILAMSGGAAWDPVTGWRKGPSVAFGDGVFVVAGHGLKTSVKVPAPQHIDVDRVGYEAGTLQPGENLDFTATLRNAGGNDDAVPFDLAVVLSRSGRWDDAENISVGEIEEPPVAAGELRAVDSSVALEPSIPAGAYYLLVAPVNDDSPAGTLWRSESKNLLVQRADADKPALGIVSVEPSAEWTSGERGTVSVEIANTSETAMSPGDEFSIDISLGSEPDVGHSEDTLVGQATAGDLQAGETITKSIDVTPPPELAQGQYFLKVAINADGAVVENDYADNFYVSGTRSQPLLRGITREPVSSGDNHSAVVRDDGSLWTWGDNTYGQVGDGTTSRQLLPVRIGTEKDWVAVSAGLQHTLALKSDGSLWAWGDNSDGQLGIGSFQPSLAPKRVGSSADWATISAGAAHSLALRADGSLWAWGDNSESALGIDADEDQPSPTRVGEDTDWIAITAERSGLWGVPRSAAIKANGTLWYWSVRRSHWSSEILAPEPTRLNLISNWTSLSAYRHFAATTADGEFRRISFSGRPSATAILEGRNWKSVAGGGRHLFAFQEDGSLWAWGNNVDGVLGAGTTEPVSLPFHIESQPETRWVAATGGHWFSLAKQSDGTFWSWGANDNGQLGQGDRGEYLVPTEIAFIEPSPPTDYATWRDEHFSESDGNVANADAAPAGVSNLLSFALGLDPWQPDRSRFPEVAATTDESTGDRYLTITYIRARNRVGITESIEASTDMTTWEPIPTENIQVIEQTAKTEVVRGRMPVDMEMQFLRVRMSADE